MGTYDPECPHCNVRISKPQLERASAILIRIATDALDSAPDRFKAENAAVIWDRVKDLVKQTEVVLQRADVPEDENDMLTLMGALASLSLILFTFVSPHSIDKLEAMVDVALFHWHHGGDPKEH